MNLIKIQKFSSLKTTFQLSIFLLFLWGSIFQTQAQNISKLDKQQSFKNIRMGDSIQKHRFFFEYEGKANDGYDVYSLIMSDSLPFVIPADSLNKTPTDTLISNPYLHIGYIQVRKMILLVYKELIYEIIITLDVTHFVDIKDVLIKAYGEPNELPCEEIESEEGKRTDCLWKGKVMALWCRMMDYGKEQQKTLVGFKNYNAVSKIKKEMQKNAVKDLLGEN